MSVVAVFTVDAADFLLGETLAAHDDARLELERAVPLAERPAPCVWVVGPDVGAVTESLRAEVEVCRVAVLDDAGSEALVRVEWGSELDERLASLVETGATVLEAVGRDGAWRLSLRFPDHERLTAYHTRCVDADVSLRVEMVNDPASLRGDADPLTDVQRETLLVALETGYFAVPREATLTELADRLGVSDTAVSQRLRRGMEQLVAASVR